MNKTQKKLNELLNIIQEAIQSDKRHINLKDVVQSSKIYSTLEALMLYAVENVSSNIIIYMKSFKDVNSIIIASRHIWEQIDFTHDTDQYIKLKNGSKILFTTAENYENKRANISFIIDAHLVDKKTLMNISIRTSNLVISEYNPYENNL